MSFLCALSDGNLKLQGDKPKSSPFKLFQDMLATLLSVPKEELNEALEQEQAEKDSIDADACDPDEGVECGRDT